MRAWNSGAGGWLGGGIVAVLVSIMAAPAAQAGPGTGATRPDASQRLSWRDCDDGLDCATARVPLDYDDPAGRTIELALVRLPASDREHRVGSLFVNPGGPGNSAGEFVRQRAREVYPASVRARFDIVGMDPRGVGASTPVRCFADEADRRRFMSDYVLIPVGDAEVAAAGRKTAELAQRCRARMGWLLPHLSTADVARDLDRMRAAVGDTGLTYAGYSYGTYLGATYANLFPGRVRAMAFDGNTDPSAYAGGSHPSVPFVRVNAHRAAADTLDQFFVLCKNAGARCDFAAGGDPKAKFATLARRLSDAPVEVPGAGRVGYAELVDYTVNVLYHADGWAAGASLLQQLYTMTGTGRAGPDAAPAPALAEPYDNVLESLWASVCGDTTSPADPRSYPGLAAGADRQAPYVGAYWTYLALPCSAWTGPSPDRYVGPWQVRTAGPVLVLNNRFDPATGHGNAIRMTALLPGSRLVTNEGWGHTVRDTRSACADGILARYLIETRLPPRGTTCRPGIVPFT